MDFISCTDQLLHCRWFDSEGVDRGFVTFIYAHNQLQNRIRLWQDLRVLAIGMSEQWVYIGDFNNVLTSDDRIGGNPVLESEYRDLVDMMDEVGLYEVHMTGERFTWSNKHEHGTIYSRIDRALGNAEWFQANPNVDVEVLVPGLSDHSPLRFRNYLNFRIRHPRFRFINYTTKLEDFPGQVMDSWRRPGPAAPQLRLWAKLKRLQPTLKQLQKKFRGSAIMVQQIRDRLQQRQEELRLHRFEPAVIRQVKEASIDLEMWLDIDEHIVRQKSKIDWIQLGDDNTSFFHAQLKDRNRCTGIRRLETDDGRVLLCDNDFKAEIMNFYSQLVGHTSLHREGIDIGVIHDGKSLNQADRSLLIQPISCDEIDAALKDMGDLKAPGIDGYNAFFFKKAWHLIKRDVYAAVFDFFDTSFMYPALNCTLVTLIPKTPEVCRVRDM